MTVRASCGQYRLSGGSSAAVVTPARAAAEGEPSRLAIRAAVIAAVLGLAIYGVVAHIGVDPAGAGSALSAATGCGKPDGAGAASLARHPRRSTPQDDPRRSFTGAKSPGMLVWKVAGK